MLRRVSSYLFLLFLIPVSLGCAAEDSAFKAGVDYEVLPQAVRTANSSKIGRAHV